MIWNRRTFYLITTIISRFVILDWLGLIFQSRNLQIYQQLKCKRVELKLLTFQIEVTYRCPQICLKNLQNWWLAMLWVDGTERLNLFWCKPSMTHRFKCGQLDAFSANWYLSIKKTKTSKRTNKGKRSSKGRHAFLYLHQRKNTSSFIRFRMAFLIVRMIKCKFVTI